MTRVHDMGGRFGDGPVQPAAGDAPVFAEEWHGRALAVTLAAGALGQWTLDRSRFARECLAPADYLAFSYYEKWLAGLADLLVAQDVVSRAELARAEPVPSPLAARRLRTEVVAGVLARGGPVLRDGPAPRFAPGDRVRTRRPARNLAVTGGHTRLPGYAAGLTGVVERAHGCHVFPDTNAHGLGEQAEPLYTVVFDAAEVWGAAEAPGDTVSCDLWESYLEPET
ncbi:nitrile hydratase subunit beta [Mameliella alba]|uniref:nitrile hydratase subunit beta n=1 Tax=Mameliella alba TaxID=561184 RepID=UPI000B535958|nr:nitrile hydratase subunit beta [Mameliella alba]MBY6118492.1 nitrile hydratase subunit beta [Mameliella alba]OWV43241.1 nitrile hydratase subunit beta [Mameliella alba]OWV68378.1 nitrile hydratase subunit beta [Mameliella alba]